MSRRSNLVHVSLIAGLIVAGCSDDTLLEPSANFHVVPQIGLAKRFVAPLSGAAEVPPVDTRGRGVGQFHLSRDGKKLHFRLVVFNTENVTQAHIHIGTRDENGPVVAFLFGFVEGGITVNGLLATGTITDDDIFEREGFDGTLASLVERMRRGETYVNTHTVAFPPGEIRGQIRPVRKHGTSGIAVLDLSDPSQPSNAAECISVDEEGTVRFRHCEFSGPITGDLEGFEPISVIDLRIDAFGNGFAKGSFIFDVCHAVLGCGLFEGRLHGPITAGMAELTVKARGTSGDFVGLGLGGTSTSPGNNVFTLDFTIFTIH